MLPHVTIYNEVSVDGSIDGFEHNLGLYYQLASGFESDLILVGSVTAKTGVEIFMGEAPEEMAQDYEKPEKDASLPLWAIVDSKGILKGMMHFYRRFEYCRDVIVLVSESTPSEYLEYLRARDYDFIIAGEDKVDLKVALERLHEEYLIKNVRVDSGGVLSARLLEEGLADEVVLLVSPAVVGKGCVNLFRDLSKNIKLDLKGNEVVEGKYVLLRYEVEKS